MSQRELLALMVAILKTAKPGADANSTVREAHELLRAVDATIPEPMDRMPARRGLGA